MNTSHPLPQKLMDEGVLFPSSSPRIGGQGAGYALFEKGLFSVTFLTAANPSPSLTVKDSTASAQTIAETATPMKISFWERFGLVAVLFVVLSAGGLLFYEKDHDARTRHGLMTALEKGDADEVKRLLSEGVDPNTCSESAIEKPDVSTLLRCTLPDVARKRPGHKTTALMMAVMSRHGYLVSLLLDKGAKVNEPDEYGFTVLSLAISEQRLDLVQQLLEHGADPNLANESHMPNLNWAIMLRDEEIVHALLEKGADAKGQDNGGMPALYLACVDEDKAVLRLLLEHGAKPDVTYRGWSTLHLAVTNDNAEITSLLLEKGADSRETLEDGRSLIELAIAEKKLHVLPILKQALPKQTAVR